MEVDLTSLEIFENHPMEFVFEPTIENVLVENDYQSNEKAERKQLKKLKIYHQGKHIQTIAEINSLVFDEINLIELEDLNFDGYFDFKISEYFSDRSKNDVGFRYYIYAPKTKLFISNSVLNDYEYLTFDGFRKEITRMTADGKGNESTYYYKWKSKTIKLVKKEEDFENNAEKIIIEYPY